MCESLGECMCVFYAYVCTSVYYCVCAMYMFYTYSSGYVLCVCYCWMCFCCVCCVLCMLYDVHYVFVMCCLYAFVCVVWGVYFLHVLCDMLCKCVSNCMCMLFGICVCYICIRCTPILLYTYSVWMSVCVHVMLECNPEVIEVFIFPHRNHTSLWDNFNEKDLPEIRKIHRTHVMQIRGCSIWSFLRDNNCHSSFFFFWPNQLASWRTDLAGLLFWPFLPTVLSCSGLLTKPLYLIPAPYQVKKRKIWQWSHRV